MKSEKHIAKGFETTKSMELTFECVVSPRAWMAILGFPTTNNWRKMHGGIMDRRCGKRKRK